MTTLLSPARVDFARSVKTSSAVLIVLMLINQEHPGHSTTADEIRDIIEMDVRTIGNHLRSLSARNLAIYDGHGYVLVEENTLILGNQALALSPVNSQALALEEAQALSLPNLAEENSALSPSENQISDTHTVCALVVEDSSLTLVKKDSTSTTYLHTLRVQQLTAAQVFQASGMLFGEPVFLIANISTIRALSVFAHVYDLQDEIRKPARVAWKMLKDGKEARAEYVENPWKHLADAYLEALHVIGYRCTVCAAQELFETRQALEEHNKAVHPLRAVCPVCLARFDTLERMEAHFDEQHEPKMLQPDESITVVVPTGTGKQITPQALWESVKGQLQSEMPRAGFDTWVRDTEPVRFDGNTLTIGCRNVYACDWLESRLTSTVQRLLIGILAKEVSVIFCVAEVNES